MSEFTCEFCGTVLSSLKSLDNHKKLAKYCLIIQGKTMDEKYRCNGCDKVFPAQSRLVCHQSSCLDYQISVKTDDMKRRYEDEKRLFIQQLREKDEQIDQFKHIICEKDEIIRDLAEKAINNAKPTIHNTTINNHIENLQIITSDHLLSQSQHLTLEHIKRGALGYSEYLLEYPLKDRIVCTDYSRRKLKYKNEDGELVTDPELTKLSDLLFKSIKDRNRELTVQYSTELTEKFKTAKDPSQLTYFMELASKFSDQDMEVFRMFNGDKNEFFHDIIRDICSKTLK